MARFFPVFAAALLLMSASVVEAQDEGARIGIGVGLSTNVISDVQDVLTPTVYIPIELANGMLIEPQVGLVRSSSEDDFFEETFTSTLLTVGAGLLLEAGDLGEDRVYVGPRAGIVRISYDIEDEFDSDSESEINFFLAGVIGGEFFLRPNFSLGGEAGLKYLDLGFENEDASLLSTTAEFRVRWYFP